MTDLVQTADPPDGAAADEDLPRGQGDVLDLPRVLRNIVCALQVEPARYRRFGVFWWPMKALLRRAGYDREQLYLLGTYQDPETAALVPAMDLQGTIRAALDEYRFNTAFPHSDGRVEDPDGDLVTIADDDAAL